MTTQEPLPAFAPSSPPNWFALAVLGKSIALREAQSKMSYPNGLTATAEPLLEQSSALRTVTSASAPQQPEKTESSIPASHAAKASNLDAASLDMIPSALKTPSATADLPESEALRTEVLGPPPRLPQDNAYWPLNPIPAEAAPPVPPSKKKGNAQQANKKHSPSEPPADFTAPTNINGKMPYALYQKVTQRGPSKPSASTSRHSALESGSSLSAATEADNKWADTDSVATATAPETREPSPDASMQISDSMAEAEADPALDRTRSESVGAHITSPVPMTVDLESAEDAMIKQEDLPDVSHAPRAALGLAGADPVSTGAQPLIAPGANSSPAVRRVPSMRGASIQAAQSITSAYTDPVGAQKAIAAKKGKGLLNADPRGRRSESAGTNGAVAPSTAAAGTAPKKVVVARSGALAQIDLPAGMMVADGGLRVIPGIAGALAPVDDSASSRMEGGGASNNDFCEACGATGRFLCCDGCPRSFHFFCMNPPLDIDEMPPCNGLSVLGPTKANADKGKGKGKATGSAGSQLNPDEMWFCNICVAERKPKAAAKRTGLGPFGSLLPILSQQNPKSFQLPLELRTYFKDAATASDGDFIDNSMVRPNKVNKFGFLETRDPYRLKDKNGNTVLCYRCGDSALPPQNVTQSNGSAKKVPLAEHGFQSWREIVSCDFCQLHWHMDCVSPPMLRMPSDNKKWMCPAHSDHHNEKRWVPRVGTAIPRTMELPLPHARNIGPGKYFRTRVRNNGDIDIIPDPLEELMGVDGRSGSLDSGVEDALFPAGDATGTAILAPKIRYRYPEKVIQTDFWTRVGGNNKAKIGDIFYVAAQELGGKKPIRAIVGDESVAEALQSRYRPFGERYYARSGLDSLADIAIARLVGDELAKSDTPELIRPSKTRELVAKAFGIDLTNDDVPESNLRASMEDADGDVSMSGAESPLSSLAESEVDEVINVPSRKSSAAIVLKMPAPASEEEEIKRIAREAASGEAGRLSKRKAAVAAESAISGSPSVSSLISNKKQRSDSPTVIIPASSNGNGTKIILRKAQPPVSAKSEERSTEFQQTLAVAHHMSEQSSSERKEIEALRAIRELMTVKGYSRTLEFLLSPNEGETS